MKKRLHKMLLFSICLSLMLCSGQSALADVEFKDLNSVLDSAQLGFEQYFFYRVDTNPYHGLEIVDGEADSNFGEIVSKLRLTAAKEVPFANLEAQFALIYKSTIDLDMYLTAEDEDELTVNQAWFKFGNLFGSPLSLSIGEQDVKIEKQFLVGIGQYNPVASWLFQDQSFPLAIKLDGDFGPLKSNLFWAESRQYWQNFNETFLVTPDMSFVDDVEVAGLNLHYDINEGTYLYGGIIAKLDGSDTENPGLGFSSGSNTINYDLGIHYTVGPLLLEAEAVLQTGDAGTWGGVEQDRDAFGGFAAATWNFGGTLAPYLKLQVDHFSGDEDFNDGTFDSDMEAFDPMFYGFPGWQRWFIGEVAGELHLDNSNKQVFILEAGFQPHPTTTVSAHYLHTRLPEEYAQLTPLSDDHWSDEVNVFVDYFPSDHLYLHLGLGWATPGDAAEELLGDDDDIFVQALIGFFF